MVLLTGLHVLVLEDDPVIATDVADIVQEAEGELVGPLTSVKEAARLIKSDHIDVAILDVNLAEGEVTPVLEALRARHIPVVVYTGGKLPERVAQRHPELKVLQKPVLPAKLVAEVARARKAQA